MIERMVAGAALLGLWVGSAGGIAQSDPLAARSRGAVGAPVTVYEMSDFQCPYCREFALGTLPDIEREYVATGKVRLVYINFPLTSIHTNAQRAAEAAMCAARQTPPRFWPIHDLLFRHQDDWAKLANPDPYFQSLGDSLRLDHASFARCLSSHATLPEVLADAERARRAGARSTPTFYVDGGLLEGAAPASVFHVVLDSIYQSKTTPH